MGVNASKPPQRVTIPRSLSSPPSEDTKAVPVKEEDKEMVKMFREIAGDDGQIDFHEWVDLCLNKLRMNLEHTELRRVFDQVDVDSSGFIDQQEFIDGMKHFGFLKSVASALAATKSVNFTIPSNYDYTKTTNDNYKADPSEGFAQKYKSIRKTRDYSYHTYYSMERQLWQDAVISTIALRNDPQILPWVVFTCGGMGAGKGYVLSWMSQNGFFPLEQIVHVDPDHFKSIMPEWDQYVAHNKDAAGSLCQRESGFMGEIAQEVAMRNRQHLWIDGSLRDGVWYAKVFDDLRRRFPDYRIAIFYIHASEHVVRQRVAKRAAETGRDVPEQLIMESLAAPKDTLARLVSKADFLARINNDEYPPKLEAFEVIDRSGSFSLIKNQFATAQPPPNRFPQCLAPITIRRCSPTLVACAEVNHNTLVFGNNVLRNSKLEAVFTMLNANNEGLWTVKLAPKHPVTIGQKGREEVMIPAEARSFAWAHPSLPIVSIDRPDHFMLPPPTRSRAAFLQVANHGKKPKPSINIPKDATNNNILTSNDDDEDMISDDDTGMDKSDPDVNLAINGGFVYFDAHDRVVRIHAVMGFAMDWKARVVSENDRNSTDVVVPETAPQHKEEAVMQFEPAEKVDSDVERLLRKENRLDPVTWQRIRECTGLEALEMAWVNPCEKLGSKKYTVNGGFAFMASASDDPSPSSRFPVLFQLASV